MIGALPFVANFNNLLYRHKAVYMYFVTRLPYLFNAREEMSGAWRHFSTSSTSCKAAEDKGMKLVYMHVVLCSLTQLLIC